jgi:hypothetical protein
VTLFPGQSRDFVTFYGLGTVSGSAGLSISGPTILSIVSNQWSPNPFTVTAYVSNTTGVVLTNVQATLGLPTGLRVASGDTGTHTIISVAPGATGQTSSTVQALQDGNWTYEVAAIGRTVSRSVSVPRLSVDAPHCR